MSKQITKKQNQYRDNIKRVKRAVVTLENSARYDGEWDVERTVRDGKGM